VVAGRDDLTDDYLRAIELELSSLGQPQPVDTLFCGGGTPTHLVADSLHRFFTLLKQWFPLSPGGEFSVEANPEDITNEKVAILHSAGVNRVSLGVQSFAPQKLKILERVHSADDVLRGVELLRPHVQTLSIDLIFAAPGESLEGWRNDLDSVKQCTPDHISTYGLTYERGTRFFARQIRSELAALDEDVERQMYELAIDELTTIGFEHYEVSNFARAGFRCRHNENYWLGGEFFGIGPGAASYIHGCRTTNHRSTTTYLRRVLSGTSPVAESETLDHENRARERLVFGLRRLDGVKREEFRVANGVSIEQLVGESLELMLAKELLLWSNDHLRLTRKGLLVSDSIWPYFLS